jgi:hypothetical protein
MENFTLTELTTKEFAGNYYGIKKLRRVISEMQVPVVNTSHNGNKLYSLPAVALAIVEYDKKHPRGSTTAQSAERNRLIEEKLRQEIIVLKQKEQFQNLEINSMKRNLIDTNEVRQFLLMYMGTLNALLKQILLVNAPIDLHGLDNIPEVITKCEEYYNQLQEAMKQTGDMWKHRNNIKTDNVLPEGLLKILQALNDAVATPAA